ncbi:hypothetical protein [Cyanobium sp. CH-040]|uniref:hypothetical protein n=1 Tax=Cyanobium sp. CH-040 TaxID=2823708 RepID=UPI0020CC6E8B|nr:hypothetical protein [Cyanobium sp. CH-040]MCP9928832.1 hypothetical protein [Cyanobium sp. CH-040]
MTSSSYRELRALISARGSSQGITIGSLHPPQAAAAAEDYGVDAPSAAGDRLLLAACDAPEDREGAFLCLRCHVSHPLEQKICGLYGQFGDYYGLDEIELASFALDDDGRPLDPARLRGQPTAAITPFTAQVICSYDPSRGAGLPHWARTRLQAHNDLKVYLKEHGLLLISDWALLADTSSRRIRGAWEVFGGGSLTADRAVRLHGAYLAAYPAAKAEHRRRSRRSSGWQPDAAFLHAIAPEQPAATTSEQLEAMARTVRLVLTQQWQRSRQADGEQADALEVPDPRTLQDLSEQPEHSPADQLTLIHAALERALEAVMPAVLAPAASDPQLHCLWQGYGEGLTNTPLAERCGCSRGTVSKKLRPEQHASTIARQAAGELLRQPAFSALGGSVEDLERMVEALRNHLLIPEREGDIAPLRRWVHQHLPVS